MITNVFSTEQSPSAAADIHSFSHELPSFFFSWKPEIHFVPKSPQRVSKYWNPFLHLLPISQKDAFLIWSDPPSSGAPKWSLNVLSFRLTLLYIFHSLTNLQNPPIVSAFVYHCYYDTSLISKRTFSIILNTYTTLSHATFRKLLFSSVFLRRWKKSFNLLVMCYK